MGTLLRQSLTLTRLRAAFARVRENNGQPGVDGVGVEQFSQGLAERLESLRTDVAGGRYQPSPLKRVWLPRPGKPPRAIGIPVVRDRVLQTAVAQTLTPLLEAEFEECSYAYRHGRSVRMAVERIGLLQRQGYRWVVEADIEQFFDNIPHDKLLLELREIARDDALIELVGIWLTTPVQDGERLRPVTLGVPQGSPLSPLLANLYLDRLDEALLDEGHALIRYADDFVVLAKNRDRADAAVEITGQVLRDLELKLNPLKTRVVNFETGFKFLGWNFVRSLAVPVSRAGEESPDLPASTIIPGKPSPQLAGQTRPPTNPEMAEAFTEALAKNPSWQAADDSAIRVLPVMAETEDEDGISAAAAQHLPALAVAPHESTEVQHGDAETQPPVVPPPSLQRTLYLVDPAASLATENHHLLVRREEETLLDLPAVSVDQVMLFGRNPVTTAALVCCMQHDIPVAFLSRTGKFYGRLEPPSSEAVNLLAAQFAVHAEGHMDVSIAREIVRGKLGNSALLLARYARHRHSADATPANNAIQQLRELGRRTRSAQDLDTLRGLEGAGAAAYFAVWRIWLDAHWKFGARVARAGGDPINALLDFGYTLLRQSVAGLIQARGLNPWLGHLHRPRSGHMALASDMMEEFRPMVVDTVLLNMCLNGKILPEDFVARDSAWTMRPEAARNFIREIETRLNTERRHPASNELLDLRRIMDAQVRNLCTAYRQRDPAAFCACVFR